MSDVTRIIQAMEQGDPKAAEEFLPLVYDELRQLAARKMAEEDPGQTLQPTALVHEAYLRLVGPAKPSWDNRRHFFAAAAEAMRRILIEHARRRQTLKHGFGLQRQSVEQVEIASNEPSYDVLAVDEALGKLAGERPELGELVKLRFFAGLTIEEAAGALGVSVATANRQWTYARAWLFREMSRGRS